MNGCKNIVERHTNFFTTIKCVGCTRLLGGLADHESPLTMTAWRKRVGMNKGRFKEHRLALLEYGLVSQGKGGYLLTRLNAHPNIGRYAALLEDLMRAPPDKTHLERGVAYIGGDLRPKRRARRAFWRTWDALQKEEANGRKSRPHLSLPAAPGYVILELGELGPPNTVEPEETPQGGVPLHEADYRRLKRKVRREKAAARRTFGR